MYLIIFIIFAIIIIPQLVSNNVKESTPRIVKKAASATVTNEKKATKVSPADIKKAEENRLFEAVKKVPASEIYKNRDMYKKLLSLAPTNQLYKNKLAHYNNKIRVAEKPKVVSKIKIVTPGQTARLCPYPSCDQGMQITRIPQGTILQIEDYKIEYYSSVVAVKWFKVTYNGYGGWVSIYDTDQQ